MTAMVAMKQWQCHKKVWAEKIDSISTFRHPGAPITLHFECGSVEVTPEYMEKHKPQVGGYYILYADGYKSFSPAAAFESGYSQI